MFISKTRPKKNQRIFLSFDYFGAKEKKSLVTIAPWKRGRMMSKQLDREL